MCKVIDLYLANTHEQGMVRGRYEVI